jgi:hypothetical protein
MQRRAPALPIVNLFPGASSSRKRHPLGPGIYEPGNNQLV